ncbi:pantetheine-phosphate adenylyltransferase [Pseudomonadales bacterium]|jgi:pantetheine-phosphate adenylyltransferase|nr:pantetheine-phosphate adenylyltransferase [Pseudomonadales bacterium]MDB3996235.1 pantetheine-phosphate adenylyltransferase [bacterium]MDA8952555.1 pantetheine-phosphate adenylyltransferase [Pseudomonadales bacterium]MDB0049956.1 pantetheine-phosphate adenylyltransferase [Pseudomonadales bacterium]MDB2596499.1 pantetheine-phosphate adenylyltransferase [Pseudomonadales bacterium]|tara:strand:+ start:501 stop:992 length:492 start_codon:yes stop_codon:yes gene_type:complete
MSKRTVVYPGSFNPITNGHTDLVERALHLFDHVVLAIGTSINKDPKVDLADRIALCEKVLAQYGDRVSVEGFNSLLVDYVRAKDTRFVLRGLRTVTDFDYEFQMAEMNRSLDPQLEYVFLPTSKDCSFISSTLVREISALGGDISQFVHPEVISELASKNAKK